ncbi:extracellular ribonuclease-like isoform X2 [Hordeum vulgare subsp. vulgare]|uniref:extracellular ribonuclease-like isoform X2 n=1 Tax=Hordeum vulgare subsp. vulgare TaxID=112509 RepID=UPI000B47AB75|nr:extracellular ribonuclease-like isoform X2 [Hordeum vulgare subsp. vulgare]
MSAFTAVIFSPAPGTLSGRTIRSPAVSRPTIARCGKKIVPEPPQFILSSRRPARSSRPPWVPPCLRALAAAAAALALVLCPPYIIPAHASSIGERLKPSTPPYPCEDVRSYYHGLEGFSGDVLMAKLGAVVSPHASLRYKDVWEALKTLDAADADHPEASSEVIEIYSQRAVPKLLAGKPDGWNREHLWPRSYGLTRRPSLTDLHNIRPADANVNSSRGNKYFGGCAATSKKCARPANREAAPDTETDSERWAPPFQVRGDVARSLMYMAVTYGFGQKDAAPPLELSDSPSIRGGWVSFQLFYNGMN